MLKEKLGKAAETLTEGKCGFKSGVESAESSVGSSVGSVFHVFFVLFSVFFFWVFCWVYLFCICFSECSFVFQICFKCWLFFWLFSFWCFCLFVFSLSLDLPDSLRDSFSQPWKATPILNMAHLFAVHCLFQLVFLETEIKGLNQVIRNVGPAIPARLRNVFALCFEVQPMAVFWRIAKVENVLALLSPLDREYGHP